jgi:uncharacterized membrane protein
VKKSFGFYAFVTGTLVMVVGLLAGLALAEKWIAFISIAILFLLLFVFLSDMPREHDSSR